MASAIHLLKSYATNDNTAMATSEIGQLMRLVNESAVLILDAIHLSALRFGAPSSIECFKKALIGGLWIAIRRDGCRFLGREMKARLKMFAQNADTLQAQQHRQKKEY